jgi:hypothetical protein
VIYGKVPDIVICILWNVGLLSIYTVLADKHARADEHRPRSRFLQQVRDVIRVRHYSYRTEQTYVQWVKRFILFHDKRHPREMGEVEVARFLTHLAVNRKVR